MQDIINKRDITKCILCNTEGHGNFNSGPISSYDGSYCICTMCGEYKILRPLRINKFQNNTNLLYEKKILISFDVRRYTDLPDKEKTNGHFFNITEEYIENIILNRNPPTALEQANNAIRVIGDYLNKKHTFHPNLPQNFYLKIGSKSQKFCYAIINELIDDGLLKTKSTNEERINFNFRDIHLSLKGWERYEAEKRGKLSGNYGFVAYAFNQSDIENLLNCHVKPFIHEKLNIEIRDMKDVAKAGIIDNIMRQQIRDSAFVIADLTHQNNGAYWEAGYAEGLDKPVIYICRKEQFKNIHFDTNHCTTVIWNDAADETENFKVVLLATIRRTLNLFD